MTEAQTGVEGYQHAAMALYGQAEQLLSGYSDSEFVLPGVDKVVMIFHGSQLEDHHVIKIRANNVIYTVDPKDLTKVALADLNPKNKPGGKTK